MINGFGLVHNPDDMDNNDDVAVVFAKRLQNVVKSKGLVRSPIRMSKWTLEFERLLEESPDEEVKMVLDWYMDRIGGDHIPQAFSAEGFRKKYKQIRSAMERDPSLVDVTDETKSIVAELRMDEWPRAADMMLPMVVQRSINNYRPFRNKVARFEESIQGLENSAPPKEKGLITYLGMFVRFLREYNKLQPPRSFVVWWMSMVHERIISWQNWHGTLLTFAFSEDSPMLLQYGREWAYDYFHESIYWDHLVRRLS